MIYLLLFTEFFKIGIFSFGGGYATIPFLYNLSNVYGWYSLKELTQMLAVASVTPGPVGINVATYAGLKTAGILGSVIATVSEIIPSLFLVILVSDIFNKFHETFWVKSLVETLKPISCALLFSVAMDLIKLELHDYKAISLFLLLLLISYKGKKDTLFYLIVAGGMGILIKMF